MRYLGWLVVALVAGGFLLVSCAPLAARSTPTPVRTSTPAPDRPRLTADDVRRLVADRCASELCRRAILRRGEADQQYAEVIYQGQDRWLVKSESQEWSVVGTVVIPQTDSTRRFETDRD